MSLDRRKKGVYGSPHSYLVMKEMGIDPTPKMIRLEKEKFSMLRRDLLREVGQERMRHLDSLPLLFSYESETQRDNLELQVLNKRLNKQTPMKSVYEEMFKYILLGRSIPVIYEPFTLPIPEFGNEKNLIGAYTPDFLLPFHYIGGKSVIIEPHGSGFLSGNYFKKLKYTKETLGFHIVLVTTPPVLNSNVVSPVQIAESVDDFWMIRTDEMHKLHSKMAELLKRTEVGPCIIKDMITKLRA